MVLSGTLKEFILADVFQLLTQQKITGKLILNNGHSDGIVVFKNGLIVGAEKEDEKFTIKLVNYLTDIKHQSLKEAKGHIASFENDLCGLTKDLIDKGVFTRSEMSSFAESVIEDITCSLFQWKHGTYNFNSLRSVDSLMVCEINIPVENIVMEAMRRVDEWNRMISVISEESIFRPEEQMSNEETKQDSDPSKSPEMYLFYKIDGKTSVKQLYENTFLSQYKVYESIALLLQSHKITALSTEATNLLKEATSPNVFNSEHPSFAIFTSILTTAVVILLITLFSNVLFKAVLFQKTTIESYFSYIDVPIKVSRQNITVASAYYYAQFGEKPQSIESLKEKKLISSSDYYFYELDSKLQMKAKHNEKYQRKDKYQ